MRRDRQIFIGYDSKHPEAFDVCRQSLIDVGVEPEIIFALNRADLQHAGFYWRNETDWASTEFTYTRFLVPFLSGYYGHSLFCDADFLWRRNPEMLFEMDHPEAVSVVKHRLTDAEVCKQKMDGKYNTNYPKKNWSSLMLFNNSHCKRLTPEAVNTMTGSELHQFAWTEEVGQLPRTFNRLVGYEAYDDIKDPIAVHFTDGGPWLPQYRDVDYSKEWLDVQYRIEQSRRS